MPAACRGDRQVAAAQYTSRTYRCDLISSLTYACARSGVHSTAARRRCRAVSRRRPWPFASRRRTRRGARHPAASRTAPRRSLTYVAAHTPSTRRSRENAQSSRVSVPASRSPAVRRRRGSRWRGAGRRRTATTVPLAPVAWRSCRNRAERRDAGPRPDHDDRHVGAGRRNMCVRPKVHSQCVAAVGQERRRDTAVPAVPGVIAHGGNRQVDVVGMHQWTRRDRVVPELQAGARCPLPRRRSCQRAR